jgi:hypothetical protein
MDVQRLRNLTTGRLHTRMEDVYLDIEYLTGVAGVMTHQLPNALFSLEPWLRQMVADQRFFDGQFDPMHTGQIDVPPMDGEARKAYFGRFAARN